jgi:16S rRNA (uracil1498-N3)-methyltransferase
MNLNHTSRLYVPHDITVNAVIELDDDQTHYIKNVMRSKDGTEIRIFNGNSDEFLASWHATGKKISELRVVKSTKSFQMPIRRTHLFFPLIKKDRMDWLIEKSIELGATDLHPIITDHVSIRDINIVRTQKQIIEATEQCERLDIAILHDLKPIKSVIETYANEIQILVAIERENLPHIKSVELSKTDRGFLFGPEGGFSESEKEFLRAKNITPVTLGDTILRAETAGLVGLINMV